ncbi:hypothetical protein [Acinetobacter sp. NIPH 2100]|uniref:hypothetical protein n=1 Tax=Acinetobacter sp. NIPH 2100 TaxID=1217708 RepID=UPI0002CF01D8|nr:hypothetical protein [Acinetobacter sp. NIPH 2100]ENX39205.1 hypothetical protein F887_03086 [Acinetobacter sp. NIPH 2100]
MKEKKLVGYTLIALLLIYIIFVLDKHEEFRITLVNDDLTIEFPNEIFVKHYAIKDFEKNISSNATEISEYKTILEKSYYKKVDHISISNIYNYSIRSNHAYFYVMTQENDKELNARLNSIGFCLKNNYVLMQKSREKDSDFITKCHDQS